MNSGEFCGKMLLKFGDEIAVPLEEPGQAAFPSSISIPPRCCLGSLHVLSPSLADPSPPHCPPQVPLCAGAYADLTCRGMQTAKGTEWLVQRLRHIPGARVDGGGASLVLHHSLLSCSQAFPAAVCLACPLTWWGEVKSHLCCLWASTPAQPHPYLRAMGVASTRLCPFWPAEAGHP
jgi:hypothetical protein